MPQHRTKNRRTSPPISSPVASLRASPSHCCFDVRIPPGFFSESLPLERALAPRYLGWLAHENSIGANIYVAANPLHCGSRKRTKECIAAVRHLYLDLDTDGEARLTSLRASDAVPPPNAIVSTSFGKYQVLWRVDGFTSNSRKAP